MEWSTVDEAIENRSLLKHPFYQAWSKGELTLDDLRHYAGQYYSLESLFPRLLSRIHSALPDPEARQAVLENLVEEERGPENHRELWLRFAEGVGLGRDQVLAETPAPKTLEAMRELEALAADPDPAVGLVALYAYESQLPKISAAKIDGLKRFYGIDDARSIRFFEAHREVDVWHSSEERRLAQDLGIEEPAARAAAERACSALWTFLDGVDESTRMARGASCSC